MMAIEPPIWQPLSRRRYVAGQPPMHETKVCDRCDGAGVILHPGCAHLSTNDPACSDVECPECFGKGKI